MKKILVIILLLIKFTTFSQKGNVLSDKEYYSLQEKVKKLSISNRDSSFIIATKIENSNKYHHKAFALGIKSYLFQLNGDSIRSKETFRKAIYFFNKEVNSKEKLKLESNLLNFEGLSEWKRGHFLKALDCFDNGKSISERIDDRIQMIKFISNKAVIFSEIGEYNKAITITKEVLHFVDKNINLYDEVQYNSSKSLNNLQLGWYYQKKYQNDISKKTLLDSSTYYYQKSLEFSENFLINKINATKSIGINYLLENDFEKSLSTFNETLVLINDNDLRDELANIYRNIGYIFYSKKKYTQSLIYLKKIDSLYNIDRKLIHVSDYINSNYYQAKINQELGDLEKANTHSKIYFEHYKNNKNYLDKNKLDLINKISNENISKEMLIIHEEYNKTIYLNFLLKGVATLIVLVLLFLLLKSIKDKRRIVEKVNKLIEDSKKVKAGEIIQDNQILKKKIQISIDEGEEILKKIKVANERKDFLKQEFNQQYLAKKLKTNTTYLSYIFNKVYNKTFSAFYNDMRLEHVINEILVNKKYREYSTQAIAESVGFKNADSFTISFKKKTGLTPYQFINEIKKREI